MSLLRRIRSALLLGAVWGLVWAPAGVLHGLAIRAPFDVPLSWRLTVLGIWTTIGFLSGCVFALLLAAAERHRALEELSPRRIALWGALGGWTFPLLASLVVVSMGDFVTADGYTMLALMPGLGAASAAGTLWLARRSSEAPA